MFESLKNWFSGLNTTYQYIAVMAVVVVAGILFLYLMPSVPREGGLLEKNRTSLLGKIKTSLLGIIRKPEYPQSNLTDIMCGYMFKHGLRNMTFIGNFSTWYNTTNVSGISPILEGPKCYSWNGSCVCIE